MASRIGKQELEAGILEYPNDFLDCKKVRSGQDGGVSFDNIHIRSLPDEFISVIRFDRKYKVPEGLRNPRRYPSQSEIRDFLFANKDIAVSSDFILHELYGVG